MSASTPTRPPRLPPSPSPTSHPVFPDSPVAARSLLTLGNSSPPITCTPKPSWPRDDDCCADADDAPTAKNVSTQKTSETRPRRCAIALTPLIGIDGHGRRPT